MSASNLRVKSSKSMSSSSSLFFFSLIEPEAEWVGVSIGTVGNSGKFELNALLAVGIFLLGYLFSFWLLKSGSGAYSKVKQARQLPYLNFQIQ